MIGEAALVALAAAIYVADCVVLLERGQALVETRWRGIALSFGSRHYQLAGKAVTLLNPFTPFFSAFRSLALFSSPGKESTKVSKAVTAVAPLAPLALLQLLLLFVALPYCLYRAPGWPFLIALSLGYLNALAMLVGIFLRFKARLLPTRPLIALGFGWIVCLPLSVNCLRAAGLSVALDVDAIRAMQFVPEDEKQSARAGLAAQITEAMNDYEESGEHHRRLAELARQLTAEAGHGRL